MKKILFYVTMIPLAVFYLVWNLMLWIPAVLIASNDVIDNLLARYEYWAFDVPYDSAINSPFNQTLKEVWVNAFERY